MFLYDTRDCAVVLCVSNLTTCSVVNGVSYASNDVPNQHMLDMDKNLPGQFNGSTSRGLQKTDKCRQLLFDYQCALYGDLCIPDTHDNLRVCFDFCAMTMRVCYPSDTSP